jgi:glycosyltransferase involved in cell wall biosynthesis
MINSDNPLVSIIINCYNGDRFLCEAIDSVYRQTYTNWEVIFWDNASTDNSAKIAKMYNDKLRYFKAESTTDLGEARVLAVNKAKGRIFAFLDCDDIWKGSKLHDQVALMLNESDAGLVYSQTDVISEYGKKINLTYSDRCNKLPSGHVFNKLVKGNFITFASVIVSRESYYNCGGFPLEYKNSPDYALFLKISHKYKIYSVDKILCSYRVHDNNLSKGQRVINSLEAINAVSKFLPLKSASIGLQYHYANLFINSILELNIKTLFFSIVKIRKFDILIKRGVLSFKNVISK